MKKFKAALSLLLATMMIFSVMATGFAAETTKEVDPNDKVEDATPFVSSASGVISDENDVDYFKFTLEEASSVIVALDHSSNDSPLSYFKLTVYNSDMTEEAYFVSNGNENTKSSNVFAAQKGTHYVMVTGGVTCDPLLTYTIGLVKGKRIAAEVEPNDEPAKATLLTLVSGDENYVIYGFASNKNDKADVDYYRLNAPTAGYIALDIINDNGNKGAYKVTLMQALGNIDIVEKTLASFTIEDNGSDIESSTVVNVDQGNYYLKIEPFEGTYGGYKLDIYYKAENNRETEYNNDKENADFIANQPQSVITGTLSAADDEDWYKVVIGEKTKYIYIIFAANVSDIKKNANQSQNPSWLVTVYNEDGITKADGDSSFAFTKAEGGKYVFSDLEPGTYYIKVKEGSAFNSARYTLTVLEDKEGQKDTSFLGRLKAFITKIMSFDFSGIVEFIKPLITGVNLLPMLASMISSVVAAIKDLLGI